MTIDFSNPLWIIAIVLVIFLIVWLFAGFRGGGRFR